MDVGTIQAQLARRFGYRPNMEAEILLELQAAQEYLEKELLHTRPWFLLTEMSSAAITADEERLQLPANFESEYEQGTLWLYDATWSDPWHELSKGVYDQLKAEYTGTGKPEKYSVVGTYFRLHPTPDEAYTAKVLYYKHDDVLVDSDSENEWLTHVPRLVTAFAGLNLSLNLRDAAREERFQGEFNDSMAHFHIENINRRMVNFTPDDDTQ